MPEILASIVATYERMSMLDDLLFEVAENTGNFREEHFSRKNLSGLAKQLLPLGGAIPAMTPEDLLMHLENMCSTYEREIARLGGA